MWLQSNSTGMQVAMRESSRGILDIKTFWTMRTISLVYERHKPLPLGVLEESHRRPQKLSTKPAYVWTEQKKDRRRLATLSSCYALIPR